MIKQKTYETIINNLPIGFTTVDENGVTIDFNQAAELITGFSKEEVIGSPHNEVFHPTPGEEPCPLFKHAILRKEPATAKEKTFIKKTGEIITLLVSVAPLYDSDGNFIGGVEIFRDVTEIKRFERERQHILAMFAHDMKNSITTSIGFASRILSGKLENQNECLKIILDELRTVETLITDFLEFSRFEAKEYKPEIQEIDLCNLIKKQIEPISIKARAKNISVLFENDKDQGWTITTDEKMIKRALSNILDNALKYNKPSGKIIIRLKDSGEGVLIEVEDTGIGIPESKQVYIFDAFYRISRDNKGSGLGLSIAKKIIETLGGRIWVKSVFGEGSIFSFFLPRHYSVKSP